jgi:hypothetical protein
MVFCSFVDKEQIDKTYLPIYGIYVSLECSEVSIANFFLSANR